MDIKNIFVLLFFCIAIIGIIMPANAVSVDKIEIKSIKAKFKAKNVKVTLNANGGKLWDVNGGKSKSIISSQWKIGDKYTVRSIPSRSGYEFKGWYTKKTGGKKITKTITLTRSVTLYARWKVSVLKIKIEYDGVFTAGYGTDTKNRKGFHSEGYYGEVIEGASYINIGAEKKDSSSRLLKLSVLKGDEVVAKKTTRAPYGEVKIYYNS